jgi:hypothetical protein
MWAERNSLLYKGCEAKGAQGTRARLGKSIVFRRERSLAGVSLEKRRVG